MPTASRRPVPSPRSGSGGPSDVEAELHDVAVLHDVVLALYAHPAVRAGLRHRAGLDELVERDDLRLDEAALEVGVDDAGRLRGGRTDRDRPGPRLLGPGRQVGL